jgi:hypothetical protein
MSTVSVLFQNRLLEVRLIPCCSFSLYHHSLHNLMFALVVVAFAFARAAQKWKTGLLALLSFYVHLLEDVMGSRGPDGYQWPVSYLARSLRRRNLRGEDSGA